MGWNLLPQIPLSLSLPYIDTKDAHSKQSNGWDLEETTSTSPSTVPPTRLEELKGELRMLLSTNGGSTKDPSVLSVIEELIKINPCLSAARSSEFLGEFSALTCPNFPGQLKQTPGQEHIVQYSLGRMSFNIFQPNNLTCTVRSVRNHVVCFGKTPKGNPKFSYPLIADITIHTKDGDLSATLINEAECYEHNEINNRLMVTFTGGTLLPTQEVLQDTTRLTIWSDTFQGAYQKADEQRSYLGWIFQLFIKLVMGLTYPTDEALAKHCFHFDMKRCPLGHIDVLYQDEEIRITKGNRGTIVVVERNMSHPKQ